MVDISGDLALIDDVELVKLYTAADGIPGTPKEWLNVVAYRVGDQIVEGEPTAGGYLYRETKFRLEGPPTGDVYNPKPGDTIIDLDLVEWVIQEINGPSVHSCDWQVTCRIPYITADVVSGLQDRVWLHPSVDTPDAWGATRTTHPLPAAWFSDVPAKIMLRPSIAETEVGQRDFVEVFDIYVASDIGQVHAGDLLLDEHGHRYTIMSYQNREQIDELSVIVCEDRLRA